MSSPSTTSRTSTNTHAHKYTHTRSYTGPSFKKLFNQSELLHVVIPMLAVGRKEAAGFFLTSNNVVGLCFSSIYFLNRKKAFLSPLCRGHRSKRLLFHPRPGVVLPFSTNKVQGIGFRVVLHILFFVHEAPEYNELSSALHDSVEAGLRRPGDRRGAAVSVNPPRHQPGGFGAGHVQHVHLHGFAVERLVQRFSYVQALRRVMAETPRNWWDGVSIGPPGLRRTGGR